MSKVSWRDDCGRCDGRFECVEEMDAGVLDVVWPDGTRQRLSKEVSRELWRQFHAAPSMTIVLKDEK